MDNTHDILAGLVPMVKCKPGWKFGLFDEDGALRLVITVPGHNSYNPDQPLTVSHWFPVPTATYNEKTWRRWIFERCRGVENHELGEWFRVADERPFAPLHGPGEDPYSVHEFRDDVDRRTMQNGTIVDKLGDGPTPLPADLEQAIAKMPEPEQSESRALLDRHLKRFAALDRDAAMNKVPQGGFTVNGE